MTKKKEVLQGAPSARRAAPCEHGHGWCFRCLEPWCRVESHSTKFSLTEGCFPLCEECWGELTPTERLPYYYMLIGSWIHGGLKESELHRAEIERAVLSGG